uniref:RRM domain-containing protein n=1 Tax=Mesocestoides corti TaxID=53468 RepID=A0A5K3FYX7_MESCO
MKSEEKLQKKNASKSEMSSLPVDALDPAVRDSIAKRLLIRNMCSVKVENLPKHYNYSTILELAPEMSSCRILYDPVSRRPKRFAFIEFPSKDIASKCLIRLNNKNFGGKLLNVSLGGELSESVDDYRHNCVKLSNLHWRTSKGEISKHFPNAISIDILTKIKTGFNRKQSATAVVTFNSIEETISAVDEKQGCNVHGRKVSVMFCPKKKNSLLVGLTVYGLKKSSSESDLRALFPQASEIKMFPLGGFAFLRYDVADDCILDKKNALGASLKQRKLKVVFKFASEAPSAANSDSTVVDKQCHSLVCVTNLDRSTTADQISKLFSGAKIVSMPKKGKLHKGCAVLDFGSVLAAKRALSKSHSLNGRMLVLRMASKKLLKPIPSN